MSLELRTVYIGAVSVGSFLRRPVPHRLILADPVDVFTEATRELEGQTHESRRSNTCKYQLKKS